MSWRSFDEPPPPSLGLIELSSIARGLEATDRFRLTQHWNVKDARV